MHRHCRLSTRTVWSDALALFGDAANRIVLRVRLQGEYAYNVGVKGTAWDVANGGVNPDDATLGTGTNWDSVMDDVKDLAGVHIETL